MHVFFFFLSFSWFFKVLVLGTIEAFFDSVGNQEEGSEDRRKEEKVEEKIEG